MEEKNVGKFLSYMKKFLTMSFLSALATVAFSCFNVTKADGDLSDDVDSSIVSDPEGGSVDEGISSSDGNNNAESNEEKSASSEEISSGNEGKSASSEEISSGNEGKSASSEEISSGDEEKSVSSEEISSGSEEKSVSSEEATLGSEEDEAYEKTNSESSEISSEGTSSEEIQKTPVSLLRTVIRYRNGEDWKSIFTRAAASTHDSSGNKKDGCTGYWVVRNYEGDIVYNERNGFSRGTLYYNDIVTFEYYEGIDDLYSSVGRIQVDLSRISQDYLNTDKYSYGYTITGNEKKTGDIDPNELASKVNIKVTDSYGQPVEGSWHWENSDQSLTNYLNNPALIFSPDDNLYSPKMVTINVLNPGRSEIRSAESANDVLQNVSSDGVTSTVKKSSGITWLREESDGSAAWYGFEDPNGVLPNGARVSVKWKDLDRDEYWDVFNFFKYGGLLPEKIWQFDLQALDSNNELITDFDGKTLNIYVEIGEDWDIDEITALYSRLDDKTKETWDLSTKEITIDGKKRTFAIFSPKHFSPHYLVDKMSSSDIYENTNKEIEKKLAEWKAENPNATEDEIIAKRKELLAEELKDFTEEQKKAYNYEAGKAIYENLVNSVYEDFSKWLAENPNATEAEQEKKKKEILKEKYDALSDEDQKLIDEYLNEEINKLAEESNNTPAASTTSSTNSGTSYATTSSITPSSSSSSTSSSNSASTKTGDNSYANLLSMILAGSFAGIGSCLKKKKD